MKCVLSFDQIRRLLPLDYPFLMVNVVGEAMAKANLTSVIHCFHV